MFGALKGLLQVLQDDATVSSYELQSTGLVTALLRCLHQVRHIIELSAFNNISIGDPAM